MTVVQTLILIGVLFSNTGPRAVDEASEWAPLCQKLEEADLVFEMEFQVKGRYSRKHMARGWPPPKKDLRTIARTGKVVKVLKGELRSGSSWRSSFGYPFHHHASVAYWKAFFDRSTVRMVYYLKEKGLRYAHVRARRCGRGARRAATFRGAPPMGIIFGSLWLAPPVWRQATLFVLIATNLVLRCGPQSSRAAAIFCAKAAPTSWSMFLLGQPTPRPSRSLGLGII